MIFTPTANLLLGGIKKYFSEAARGHLIVSFYGVLGFFLFDTVIHHKLLIFMVIPKVFISYSHDTLEHKKWILELASRLRNNGIDAILDQFELQPGDDLPHFMERHLVSSNKILMVCTSKYVNKANKGEGGVGYEKMIITSNLMQRIDENKIIPIIKQNGTTDVPTFLKSKLYINFSKTDDYELSYDELVRTIHNSPLFEKPPIGNNPFQSIDKEKFEDDVKLVNLLLITIIEKQGLSTIANADSIRQTLGISSGLFRLTMLKLINLGFANWFSGFTYVHSTEKGLKYAFENGLIT